jgi:hypothetical protein
MFRVVLPPIIRSAYNCIYSVWYFSHRYCYLPLSWKSWNRFEFAACGVRHPQHTKNQTEMHGQQIIKKHNDSFGFFPIISKKMFLNCAIEATSATVAFSKGHEA